MNTMKLKLIALLVALMVLFEWPYAEIQAQQIQAATVQTQALAALCMLVVICVVIGGVIVLCCYLNSCYPLNPAPTNAPPAYGSNRDAQRVYGNLAIASGITLCLTNINTWGIPYSDTWLDPSGNRYTACFSGSTPTNLLSSTNMIGWSRLDYSITGWVSSATIVTVLYDSSGVPLLTNWSGVVQSNGFTMTTSGTNAYLPGQKSREFFEYVH